MMHSVGTFIGGTVIAGVALIATNPIFTEPAFMTVNGMRYDQGQIYVDRSVNVPRTVADWRVTIVGSDRNAPFCQTQAGPDIDQGWSVYQESMQGERQMPLDQWVGDAGCADRLTAGEYTMIVTWTPRDGTDPVVATLDFERTNP